MYILIGRTLASNNIEERVKEEESLGRSKELRLKAQKTLCQYPPTSYYASTLAKNKGKGPL